MSIKKTIINEMRIRRISQTKLSQLSHMAQKSLSAWLHNRGFITYEKLWKMCDILEIEYDRSQEEFHVIEQKDSIK